MPVWLLRDGTRPADSRTVLVFVIAVSIVAFLTLNAGLFAFGNWVFGAYPLNPVDLAFFRGGQVLLAAATVHGLYGAAADIVQCGCRSTRDGVMANSGSLGTSGARTSPAGSSRATGPGVAAPIVPGVVGSMLQDVLIAFVVLLALWGVMHVEFIHHPGVVAQRSDAVVTFAAVGLGGAALCIVCVAAMRTGWQRYAALLGRPLRDWPIGSLLAIVSLVLSVPALIAAVVVGSTRIDFALVSIPPSAGVIAGWLLSLGRPGDD